MSHVLIRILASIALKIQSKFIYSSRDRCIMPNSRYNRDKDRAREQLCVCVVYMKIIHIKLLMDFGIIFHIIRQRKTGYTCWMWFIGPSNGIVLCYMSREMFLIFVCLRRSCIFCDVHPTLWVASRGWTLSAHHMYYIIQCIECSPIFELLVRCFPQFSSYSTHTDQ